MLASTSRNANSRALCAWIHFPLGFNYLTKDEDYLTGEEIVQDLVNNVVNNGNYLLNIGPKNDSSIAEQQRINLLDAGE